MISSIIEIGNRGLCCSAMGVYSPSLTVSDGYLYDTMYKVGSIAIVPGDSE